MEVLVIQYLFDSRFVDAVLTAHLRVAPRALRIANRHHYSPEGLAAEVLDCYGWRFLRAHEGAAEEAVQSIVRLAAGVERDLQHAERRVGPRRAEERMAAEGEEGERA